MILGKAFDLAHSYDQVGLAFGVGGVNSAIMLLIFSSGSGDQQNMRVAPLDPLSIQETVEIRASLETLALKFSARRMSAMTFEKLELTLTAGSEAKSIEEWEQSNRTFHRELLVPCRMPKLLRMLEDLQLATSRIIFSAARSTG